MRYGRRYGNANWLGPFLRRYTPRYFDGLDDGAVSTFGGFEDVISGSFDEVVAVLVERLDKLCDLYSSVELGGSLNVFFFLGDWPFRVLAMGVV